MNKEDLLKSFAEMSTEDQEVIRAELAKGGTEWAGAAEGPLEMKKHMMEMMEKMEKNHLGSVILKLGLKD